MSTITAAATQSTFLRFGLVWAGAWWRLRLRAPQSGQELLLPNHCRSHAVHLFGFMTGLEMTQDICCRAMMALVSRSNLPSLGTMAATFNAS